MEEIIGKDKMVKIDFEKLQKSQEYQEYLKLLEASNGSNKGFDSKHNHLTPYGPSGPALGNNFFMHQHATEYGMMGIPIEYNPKTLKHNHLMPTQVN